MLNKLSQIKAGITSAIKHFVSPEDEELTRLKIKTVEPGLVQCCWNISLHDSTGANTEGAYGLALRLMPIRTSNPDAPDPSLMQEILVSSSSCEQLVELPVPTASYRIELGHRVALGQWRMLTFANHIQLDLPRTKLKPQGSWFPNQAPSKTFSSLHESLYLRSLGKVRLGGSERVHQ